MVVLLQGWEGCRDPANLRRDIGLILLISLRPHGSFLEIYVVHAQHVISQYFGARTLNATAGFLPIPTNIRCQQWRSYWSGPPEQAQRSAARPLAPPARLGQNINPGLYS